jgi:hypothetical protein
MERIRKNYTQDVYETNFQKYPLVLVSHSNYVWRIKSLIKTHLKELQINNREDGESNHRIVAMHNLQCNLYNVGKPVGVKQWGRVWYMTSYLINLVPRTGESTNMRTVKARKSSMIFIGIRI